jgi:hypothetical protein
MKIIYSFTIALCLHILLIIGCAYLPTFPSTPHLPIMTPKIVWVTRLQKAPTVTSYTNVLKHAQALTEDLLKAATQEG